MPLLRRRHLALLLAALSAQAGAQQSGPDGPIAQVEVKGSASYDPRRDETAARIVLKREEIAR